jgi:hypothetical protein
MPITTPPFDPGRAEARRGTSCFTGGMGLHHNHGHAARYRVA